MITVTERIPASEALQKVWQDLCLKRAKYDYPEIAPQISELRRIICELEEQGS